MNKKNNMYKISNVQWNPYSGCNYDCIYCQSSFQRQLKRWAKKNCEKCYYFKPHIHLERLTTNLPRTKYMEFIFTCSNGDIAFCPTDFLHKIITRIKQEKDKTFLIQSKNPLNFQRINFPKNVILGITLETNRDASYSKISKAPLPSKRHEDFIKIIHTLKMVTIEPVMEFDLDIMVKWIKDIAPCMVWLGYDSGKNNLPEPSLEKVKDLYWELGRSGFTTILKTIRLSIPIQNDDSRTVLPIG